MIKNTSKQPFESKSRARTGTIDPETTLFCRQTNFLEKHMSDQHPHLSNDSNYLDDYYTINPPYNSQNSFYQYNGELPEDGYPDLFDMFHSNQIMA
jgi:hypothetical protein